MLELTHRELRTEEDESCTYIDCIDGKDLRDFVIKSLNKYSNKSKLKTANKVADIVWQKFVYEGYITEYVKQSFVDITIAACLLHNLFYDEKDITSILKHRVKLQELVEETGVDERAVKYIYEIIESQLGNNHPIPRLKPQINSPAHTFSEAVWQVSTFKPVFK